LVKIKNMIATPTKKIFVQMLNDEWILQEHIDGGKINIELVLMYQHGVNIFMHKNIDWNKTRFLNVKIQDQIDVRKDEIYNIKRKKRIDYYDAEMLHIHRDQLELLQNLRAIILTQYN
jgi:hypothetical protein